MLFIVQDGKTQWAFNTSTGGGHPLRGDEQEGPDEDRDRRRAARRTACYKTNRERPEGWWEGDLGKIYRPKYFNGGVAVHGMTSVPNHPASHGCVRLSTTAMDLIWDQNLIPLRITVWVHESVDWRPLAWPARCPERVAQRDAGGIRWPGGPASGRSSRVRHRPVSRSKRQPCSVQTSSPPSISPNTVRSALRCGQRRSTM